MGDSTDNLTPRQIAIGTIVLILGAIGIGMAAPLVKQSAMEPTAVAFWRMALAIPAGLIWAVIDRKPQRQAAPPGWRKYLYLALPGLLFAGDLAFWHSGIKITTVANATFLANLQPVFVVLASWLIFRDRPTRAFLIAAAVAVTGAGLLSVANISIAPERLPGDALSLITAVWYAGYILAVRRARAFASTGMVILWTSLASAPVLLIVAFGMGENLMPPTGLEWLILIGLALGVQIGGQGSVAFGLGRVPAPVASIIILVQPVVSAIAGWFMFGEALVAIQFFGAGLVLTGVWLAQRRAKPAATAPFAKPGPEA